MFLINYQNTYLVGFLRTLLFPFVIIFCILVCFILFDY